MQKWRQQNNVERYRRNAPGPIGPDAAADAAQVGSSELVVDFLGREICHPNKNQWEISGASGFFFSEDSPIRCMMCFLLCRTCFLFWMGWMLFFLFLSCWGVDL